MNNLPGLEPIPHAASQTTQASRDGILLRKGYLITTEYMRQHKSELEELFQTFSVYPDLYLDFITPESGKIRLFPYQRLYLRAVMRFKRVYLTAPRGFSKSFLTILGMILQCIFVPGHRAFLTANTKQQAGAIAKAKVFEIMDAWPLLKKEMKPGRDPDHPGKYSNDSCEIEFKNGSVFTIVLAGDTTRGLRFHSGLVDETRDADGDIINKVVLPLLNVSRRMPGGKVNPKEPNQQALFATSAGSKQSYAYELLIDVLEQSIIYPDQAFCIGCDYRVPLMHGLLDRQFLNSLQQSSSFDPNSYATEYLSRWLAINSESWYNYDRISIHRKLKNPHWKRKEFADPSLGYYLLAWDVGRINDMSVVIVFRCSIAPTTGQHTCSIVNIRLLGLSPQDKPFSRQVIEMKRMIADYQPREVVIDINGIGRGVADLMIQQTVVPETGEILPAYGFHNNKDYLIVQPSDAPRILYGMIAGASNKPEIEANAFNRINQGSVQFLIKEQDAKTRLMQTQVGQKMPLEKKIRRLMPHEMTTRLIEEIMNFKLKSNISGKITLEPINKNMHDDRYMCMAYGLWRVKELEEVDVRRHHHSGLTRQLVFYTE